MAPYTLAPYPVNDASSRDSAEALPEYSLYSVEWPKTGYPGILRSDAYLFHRVLLPDPYAVHGSIADQVFGEQKRQGHTDLAHLMNILHERSRLHNQHLRDMDHRHMQIQERLFCVTINNTPDRAKRQSNLESQLLQLEQQRREEELAFWKDTVDVREKLFEAASAYTAARHRYSLFADVEGGHER